MTFLKNWSAAQGMQAEAKYTTMVIGRGNGMYIVECWIEHPVRQLDRTYTYTAEQEVPAGCRVRVNFAGRSLIGFAESCTYTQETQEEINARLQMKIKPVDEVLDSSPLITEELHEMALWMKEQTLSPTIACFQAMLPAKIKPSSNRTKIVTEKWLEATENTAALTVKQLECYRYALDHMPIRYSDLRKAYPSQARILIEKGLLRTVEKEREASGAGETMRSQPLPLTPLQKAAMDEIENTHDAVYLIRGVTGSGKTEVYLQLAAKALEAGRQVLILVPEIGLTPQMIERVTSRFGTDLAIYHSALSDQEKYEQYRMVMTGRARVVVGTRSAVFLPFHDLGLIVMDEEHDASYKQDTQPAYHCRDAVIWRGRYHACKVLLGSATPSLDSYARALKNVYHLIVMDQRINESVPAVSVVAMKDALKKDGGYILSQPLKQAMAERFARNEQVILLLNRRGYTPVLRCRSCQEVIPCPHCDMAMSWHRDENRLKCHTCGTEMRLTDTCPSCGSREGFTSYGFGTQRLEQEVQSAFPGIRTLRMDADTTRTKGSHGGLLKKFGDGEADVLLGTQMIAKGLDFANVTLVGVINGDNGMNRPDFRSCEVTFDLLMQAAGRSGRADKEGEVIFQVFNPDHYAVQAAAKQDYEMFFVNEMRFRHAGAYPPYTYMISLTVSASSQAECERTAYAMKEGIRGSFRTIGIISLPRIKDRCRCRIVLKGKDLDEMREAVKKFTEQTEVSLKGLKIDINPLVLE